ncbi:hypothetical protein BC938DRAFT_482011 [Jimgerdemannia flammicorona]|uniref:Uncharacterized protein n=1 Tax=Jimgerdemannia flammicorona TaxID=994334 RepID=A0A433QEU8_9FUNG|nr:hypothetical protein BC938DRAFT_482011 [Jimgerdemannia flammicorona]
MYPRDFTPIRFTSFVCHHLQRLKAYDLYYEYIASSVRHNSNSFPPRFMALSLLQSCPKIFEKVEIHSWLGRIAYSKRRKARDTRSLCSVFREGVVARNNRPLEGLCLIQETPHTSKQ